MEDGAKEDPAQCKEPKFLAKAGWLKKAPGKLLASYKDRYIQVEKTVVVVYENEDLQNCLERLDLENYDKCHELKSPFKKKQRLVLIRSAKSGNKVQDVKFQAQTAEEKEAWIKALSDGINRAKNKIFDEVKIDEGSNLEHVTRTRPKGNRNRRPPTRIHMKEVAVMSSDGILRLDLDLEDALMPNGTHQASVDGTEAPKRTTHVPTSVSGASESNEKQSGLKAEEDQAEPEVTPQKKIIKPPMPPTKEAKPSTIPEDEPDTDNVQVKKVPPMPPSKEAKPVSSVEETTEKAKAEKMPEKSPDARKKTGPPPTPPSKPSSSGSLSNLAEASQSQPNTQPPTLPLKEKKPSHDAVKSDQVQDATENREKEDKEAKGKAVETDKAEKLISQETLPKVGHDEPESPSTEENLSEEESDETSGSGVNKSSDNELQTSTELLRKSSSPPPPPKKNIKKPVEPDMQHIEDKTTITHPPEGKDPAALLQPASDTSASSLHVEVPVVVVSLNDSYADSLSLSPVLYRLQEGKKKEEEKSVDSGQHSDDDSEVSGSEDTLAVTTTASRAGLAGWNVFDGNEDDIQSSANPSRTQPTAKPQVSAQCSEPTSSPKTLTKGRSASIGDLLSDSIQVRQQTRAVAGNDGASSDDVMKLEAEVALEMEKTSRLLSRVSQSQKRGDVEAMPEDLLAKAMEKLKKADDVLREVQKLKPANNTSSRKSW